MRISATPGDDGYEAYLQGCYLGCKVYLNGKLLDRVMAVDESEGYAEVCKLDVRGSIYIINNTVATERIYGQVKIEK